LPFVTTQNPAIPRMAATPPITMPTIAPRVKGPVGPVGVNDGVGVGVVTLTVSVEKILPCMASVDPGAGCNVQAPSNTLRSTNRLDKSKHETLA
jgi:hypothetical protein